MKTLPCEITIGESYRPAMEITEQAEADAYFEALVERRIRCPGVNGERFDRAAAEVLERKNLGYFAGYYDRETVERVNRLYATEHPIFGTVQPTGREALLAGMVAATQGPEVAAKAFRKDRRSL